MDWLASQPSGKFTGTLRWSGSVDGWASSSCWMPARADLLGHDVDVGGWRAGHRGPTGERNAARSVRHLSHGATIAAE
jgi:hypothetical protein